MDHELHQLRRHRPTRLPELVQERRRYERTLAYHASRPVRLLVAASALSAALASIACLARGAGYGWLSLLFLSAAAHLLLRYYPNRSARAAARYRIRQLVPVSPGERQAIEQWCAQWPSVACIVEEWKVQGAVLLYRDYEHVLWSIRELERGACDVHRRRADCTCSIGECCAHSAHPALYAATCTEDARSHEDAPVSFGSMHR